MTVNGMPWQGRRRGSGTETSLAGHQNECAFFVLLFFFFNFFGFFSVHSRKMANIENTSWKVLAYGIYARVVDVSEIERVSAANE